MFLSTSDSRTPSSRWSRSRGVEKLRLIRTTFRLMNRTPRIIPMKLTLTTDTARDTTTASSKARMRKMPGPTAIAACAARAVVAVAADVVAVGAKAAAARTSANTHLTTCGAWATWKPLLASKALLVHIIRGARAASAFRKVSTSEPCCLFSRIQDSVGKLEPVGRSRIWTVKFQHD